MAKGYPDNTELLNNFTPPHPPVRNGVDGSDIWLER